MSIELTVLSSSAVHIAADTLKNFIARQKRPDVPAKTKQENPPSDSLAAFANASSPEFEKLRKEVTALDTRQMVNYSIRANTSENEELSLKQFEAARGAGAFALAIGPQAVFQDARRRIGLVFRINLAVSIVLAIILLGGIGGSVFSAVFLKNSIWALALGGVSAADAIGVYVYKPLAAINEALIGATRLDALQLRLSEQLSQCAQHSDLEARIRCQTNVWDAIQHELGIIGATQSQRNATTA
jgi:hypothetical protein